MDKLTSKDILYYHLVFRNVFKDILRQDKTPISEFEILMIINEKEGLKVGELSEIMSITRPNLTPLVDSLEKKELIKRIQDKNDKRVTRLYITEKGKHKTVENLEIIENRCIDMRKKYSEEEINTIKEYCDKIIKIINK